MSNNNLQKALNDFANQDLALARRNRKVAVAQTKLGTIEVEFAAGVYTVSAQGVVLAMGTAKLARDFLARTYEVLST